MRGYLYEEDITVAEVLQEAGYVTCMSGKWGLGEPDTPGEPNSQGFDEFYGFLNQRRADHHYPEWLWLNRDRKSLPGNTDGQMGQYAADEFTNYAIDFIERHQNTPFFLYVPFCIPHDNFDLPDFEPFEDKPWKDQEKAYAAMVTHADKRVGQIIEALRINELDEHTIVFVCSDNGAYDRHEGLFDSAKPFSGKKYELTEGGIRIPMIVRWPGSVPVDVSDAIWYFADVLPTLATLAGAEVPKTVDGINILPTLLGNLQPELENRFLYWEFPRPHFRQAGRLGKWKAIKLRPEEPIALYDLSVDLKETKDVAKDHPQIVADFDKQFKASHTESPFIKISK